MTPHSSTGISPAELLLKRIPRSHVNMVRSDVSMKVHEAHSRQNMFMSERL